LLVHASSQRRSVAHRALQPPRAKARLTLASHATRTFEQSPVTQRSIAPVHASRHSAHVVAQAVLHESSVQGALHALHWEAHAAPQVVQLVVQVRSHASEKQGSGAQVCA
jgi:hypothetical protein